MLKKIGLAITTSPILVNFLTNYNPYVSYIEAVTWLVFGDCLTGLLASTKEKYGSLHIAFIFKTFRSTKLIKKIFLGFLFFMGLFFIHKSDILLTELNISENKAGIYWCVAYGLYEITSILENFGRLDFPIAKQIKNWINSKVPPELQNIEPKKGEDKNGQ